jgi:TolA-binding protein
MTHVQDVTDGFVIKNKEEIERLENSIKELQASIVKTKAQQAQQLEDLETRLNELTKHKAQLTSCVAYLNNYKLFIDNKNDKYYKDRLSLKVKRMPFESNDFLCSCETVLVDPDDLNQFLIEQRDKFCQRYQAGL